MAKQPMFPPYPPLPVTTGAGAYNPNSIGQVFATIYGPLYPCLNLATGLTEYRTYDVSVPFNDPLIGSFYAWKIEEVLAYRNPTVRTVIVTYLDVGVCTTTWTVTSSQDDQTVKNVSVDAKFGNTIPTMRLMAQRISFDSPPATGQLLQLSVLRKPNAGPLAIAKVVMQVEVEKSTL